VAQLERVGNEAGLLLAVQAGDFVFELLETHGSSLTGNQFCASAGIRRQGGGGIEVVSGSPVNAAG
jgi:hypothetical protein